jgi:hypothetical protein
MRWEVLEMKLFASCRPLFLLLAASCLAGAADKQPVHIYLYERLGDYVNIELTEDRLRRVLPMIEKFRKERPQAHVSATILLSGALSEELAARNSKTGIKDLVLAYARRGVVELGYDGSDEPTYHRRPMADFSNVKTAEERWVRRGEAAERFLTEARDPLTGVPIPGATGGLKRMQEIFGPAVCITGITGVLPELGGDSESVQHVIAYNDKAIMFGVPDQDPSRNIHGFRGSAQELGKDMGPVPNSSTELFWQDNFLRSSETSDAAIRRVSGYEGQKVLEETLSKLDRSRVRIVHVELGDQRMYLKPDYAKGQLYPPLKLAYRHPENAKLPPEALNTEAEVKTAYANEEGMLRWLVEDYFAANPSSHFVSSSDLRQMTPPSLGFEVPLDKLREGLADTLKKWWDANSTTLPMYTQAGGHYLSLADTFQVLTDALNEFHRTGKFPQFVRVVRVYGPVPVPNDLGPNHGEVTVASVAKVCSTLAGALHDTSVSPIPKNRVPSRVTIEGMDLNAAQFLRLMSEALVAATPNTHLKVKMTTMLSLAGEAGPKTRMQVDQAATWTFKPAPLEEKR